MFNGNTIEPNKEFEHHPFVTLTITLDIPTLNADDSRGLRRALKLFKRASDYDVAT